MEEHLNGSIKINLKEKYLNYVLLPEKPKKEIDVEILALTRTKQSSWKPPIDHPWRKQFPQRKLSIQQPIPVQQ